MQNLSYLLPPFTSLIYAVKFSDDELARRLEYIVSKGKILDFKTPGKIFTGRLESDGFKFSPSWSSDKHAPVVIGKFYEQNGEKIVKIRIRLGLLMIVFAFMHLGLMAFGAVLSFMQGEYGTLVFGLILTIFIYGDVTPKFWRETEKIKEIFDTVFDKDLA